MVSIDHLPAILEGRIREWACRERFLLRDAKTFHTAVIQLLGSFGFCDIEREMPVKYCGRSGFIDIHATYPYRVAIELDRSKPRLKSIEKLIMLGPDVLKLVVLRTPPSHRYQHTYVY